MNKVYLLDANILLHEANTILSFPNATVVIPFSVLAQVDKFKRDLDDYESLFLRHALSLSEKVAKFL